MTKEIETYFWDKYNRQDIRVVHGHWPDFKTKEDVDKWLIFINKVFDDFSDDHIEV